MYRWLHWDDPDAAILAASNKGILDGFDIQTWRLERQCFASSNVRHNARTCAECDHGRGVVGA